MCGKYMFYAGRYWDECDGPDAESIALLVFDPDCGTLEKHTAVRGERNASYLQVLERRQLIATVSETGPDQNPHVSLYSFARSLDRPDLLARAPTSGAFPCHVQFSPSGKYLVVANYEGVPADVFLLDESLALTHHGRIDVPAIASHHERQGQPHGHSALFSDRTGMLFDLGGNCLWVFDGAQADGLSRAETRRMTMADGDGPRHGLMIEEGRLLVVNELSSSLALMDVSAADQFHECDRHVLGDGRKGNLPAAIRSTRNRAQIYVSNRGADTVECFSIVDDKIKRIAAFPVGPEPRDFCLSNDDRYLLVASQNGHRIEVFARDEESGSIRATGIETEMRSPVCIQALSGS